MLYSTRTWPCALGFNASRTASHTPWSVVLLDYRRGFIAHSILSMKHHGCRGRCRLHTVMHELNSTAYVVMWVLRLTSYALLPDATSIDVRSNRWYDYTMPIALKATSVHMASMNIFLAWFRALLFLSRVPRYVGQGCGC